MAIIEHMVDFEIVVIEVVRRSPSPRISCCIETIPEAKIIGKRHEGHQFLNRSGRIETLAIEVAVGAENTDGLQVAGGRSRPDGLSRQVYGRNRRVRVAVLDTWKEAKNSLACRFRVCRCSHRFSRVYPHTLVSTVEECALAYDRSAQTAAKLIPYQRVPGITA